MGNFIYKNRILIIVISILIGIASLPMLKYLEKNAGVESMIDKSNKDYKYFKESEQIFGKMETIVVGVSDKESIFTPSSLKAIGELTDFIKNLEEIDEDDVMSLTTVDDLIAENRELIVQPLVEEYDNLTDDELSKIKVSVDNNPMIKKLLISSDKKSTLVVARVLGEITTDEKKISKLVKSIEQEIKRLKTVYKDTDFYLSGFSTSEAKITENMTKDLMRLTPITFLVVMFLLFLMLREMKTTILPISVTLISTALTLSFKALVKSPITISEIVIPVMLISISCAYGIHLIHEYHNQLKKGLNQKDAISETLRILNMPTILSAVTTAIGFISLITAPGKSIKNMGLFLAFGVVVSLFYSLFFIPAVLSFYKFREGKIFKFLEKKESAITKNVDNFFELVTVFISKRKKYILLIPAIIIILAIFSVFNLKYDTDVISYFYKNDDFRKGTEKINETMGGISDLYVVFDSEISDIIKEPQVLKKMEELQQYAESLNKVSRTFSLVDYVKHINYLINENKEEYRRIPSEKELIEVEKYINKNGREEVVYEKKEVDGKEQVANLLLLYELGGGESLENIVNSDYSKACIHVMISDTSTNTLRNVVNQLNKYIKENINIDGIKIRYTNHYLRQVMTDLMIQSQINSLITTLIAILFLLIVVNRSFIIGLIITLPTVIAVLCNFVAMWIFRVPLDVGTSILASIGIGVGIDYAVHFYQRFKINYKLDNDVISVIKKSINECGHGILSNALAVGLGFLTLYFSSFRIIFDIGWIIALSMFTTAFAALVILPAVIITFLPLISEKIKK